MNLLSIVQTIFFFGYVFYLWKNYGVLGSISESYYTLQPLKKSHLFNVFGAGVGLPMFGFQFYIDNDLAQMFFVLSGFFMVGLSIASTFKSSKMVSSLHYLCTLFAIGFAFIGIYAEYHDWYFWYMLGGGGLGALIIALTCKNRIWWVELWVFAIINARLILN